MTTPARGPTHEMEGYRVVVKAPTAWLFVPLEEERTMWDFMEGLDEVKLATVEVPVVSHPRRTKHGISRVKAHTREMEAADPTGFDRHRSVRPQAAFQPSCQFLAVGRGKIDIGAIDRWQHVRDRSRQRIPSGTNQGFCGRGTHDILFEPLPAIFLDGIVQESEWVTIKEQTIAGADYKGRIAVGMPSHSKAG